MNPARSTGFINLRWDKYSPVKKKKKKSRTNSPNNEQGSLTSIAPDPIYSACRVDRLKVPSYIAQNHQRKLRPTREKCVVLTVLALVKECSATLKRKRAGPLPSLSVLT